MLKALDRFFTWLIAATILLGFILGAIPIIAVELGKLPVLLGLAPDPSSAEVRCVTRDDKDYRYADLSGCDFSNRDLSGAVFEEATALGANFTGANLSDSQWDNAKVDSAQFRNAQLINARFNGVSAVGANLVGVKATGIMAVGANFENANMSRGDFSSCDCSGVQLGADLTDALFAGANLSAARFPGCCDVPGAERADFTGANLSGGYAVGTNFKYAVFTDANMKMFNDFLANKCYVTYATGEKMTPLNPTQCTP